MYTIIANTVILMIDEVIFMRKHIMVPVSQMWKFAAIGPSWFSIRRRGIALTERGNLLAHTRHKLSSCVDGNPISRNSREICMHFYLIAHIVRSNSFL